MQSHTAHHPFVAMSILLSILLSILVVQTQLSILFDAHRPSETPAGVLRILNQSPSALGAPREAGGAGGHARCGAGVRDAPAAIAHLLFPKTVFVIASLV